MPYWSPDSRFLLLDGVHSLTLLDLSNQQSHILLSDASAQGNSASPSPPPPIAATNTLLQPLSNNLWATDSRHFLFLTRGRLLWQGKSLSSGKGLYTVAIDDHGQPQGVPTLVDAGNDTQAGWTYEDLNTSFLF